MIFGANLKLEVNGEHKNKRTDVTNLKLNKL